MQSKSYIIGIAGGSGSGKTSFVKALKTEFNKTEVCFVSLDDYYHPRDEQITDENGIKNFDLPSSIDHVSLLADLNKLQNGDTVSKVKYQFNNKLSQKETIELAPAKVILVEGLFIYHYSELKSLFDLKLYIEASSEVKLIRRIKRDKSERNYPIEDVMYRYEHHVMPAYKRYIEKYKREMDLIINNNKDFKKPLNVIIDHIKTINANI